MTFPPPVAPHEPQNGGLADDDRFHRLEDHLRRLLGAMTDGYIVLDAAGAILDLNPAAERLLGWDRKDLVGRRLVLTPTASGGAAGGDISQLLDHHAPSGTPRCMELPLADRRGRVFQARLNIWATDGGWGIRHHVLFSDLGAHDEGHDHAQCSVGSIVTSSGVAILGEDLEGHIVTWNRAAEEMYGYSAVDALGRPGLLVFPPAGRAAAQLLVARARRGHHVPGYETEHLRADGSTLDVSVTISPVRDPSGTVTGVSLIARDVTEQRRSAVELEAALEAARQSEASSRRFLADAAHQLRTPIAGIRACVDTLAGSGSAEEGEVLLAHMVEETSRATRLVRGLLRMARVDRGVAANPVPCDLIDICEKEAQGIRIRSPQLEVDVRTRERGDLAGLCLDPDVVQEILGNLLDNAGRHARRCIVLDVRRVEPGVVEVRVVDDGPGLAEGMVEGAFERFVSLDGRGGSGLGLPIARGLARSHGGDLTYDGGAFVLRVVSGGPAGLPPAP